MDFSLVVAIVAFLVSCFTLIDKIETRFRASKEPTKLLENRIATLESLVTQRFSSYDDHFAKDLGRIEQIERGNKVTQRAILALLKHTIDGNDVDSLKKASEDLQDYLIER